MAKQAVNERVQQLHKSLYQLQASGSAVWRDMRRTNRAFYAHVAAVYFWWRQASGVSGYLEAEYAKLNRQFKSRVKYGINFSPLLALNLITYTFLLIFQAPDLLTACSHPHKLFQKSQNLDKKHL